MSHTLPHIGVIRTDYFKTSRKKIVYIMCSFVIGMATTGLSVMIAGFFDTEELRPANDEGAARTSVLSNSLNTGEVNGKVISHNTLSPSGATVLAYKSFGFPTSFEKNGGYPIKSTISIDNTFNLDLPSGIYNLLIFYRDGTYDVIKNLSIWPNTTSTVLINY